jgi:hypothetical protein
MPIANLTSFAARKQRGLAVSAAFNRIAIAPRKPIVTYNTAPQCQFASMQVFGCIRECSLPNGCDLESVQCLTPPGDLPLEEPP